MKSKAILVALAALAVIYVIGLGTLFKFAAILFVLALVIVGVARIAEILLELDND